MHKMSSIASFSSVDPHVLERNLQNFWYLSESSAWEVHQTRS